MILILQDFTCVFHSTFFISKLLEQSCIDLNTSCYGEDKGNHTIVVNATTNLFEYVINLKLLSGLYGQKVYLLSFQAKF